MSAAPRRLVSGPGAAALPGLHLTLAFMSLFLGAIVVLPLAGLAGRAATVSPAGIAAILSAPRSLAAFRVSFGVALLAAALDVPLGFLLAWTITRYRFPGRRLLDALVDLPFALPTAVAGVALTTLYVEKGWAGAPLSAIGIHLAFNPGGIAVALVFVGLPFIVRSVQPVMAALDREAEEAALTLGAPPFAIFRRVVLPPLWPAALTGAALAFARGVGEYGSVIFIAGNRPAVSEIVPLLIVAKLEQFDYGGAAVLGTAMLVASLVMLLGINALQRWTVSGLGVARGGQVLG